MNGLSFPVLSNDRRGAAVPVQEGGRAVLDVGAGVAVGGITCAFACLAAAAPAAHVESGSRSVAHAAHPAPYALPRQKKKRGCLNEGKLATSGAQQQPRSRRPGLREGV